MIRTILLSAISVWMTGCAAETAEESTSVATYGVTSVTLHADGTETVRFDRVPVVAIRKLEAQRMARLRGEKVVDSSELGVQEQALISATSCSDGAALWMYHNGSGTFSNLMLCVRLDAGPDTKTQRMLDLNNYCLNGSPIFGCVGTWAFNVHEVFPGESAGSLGHYLPYAPDPSYNAWYGCNPNTYVGVPVDNWGVESPLPVGFTAGSWRRFTTTCERDNGRKVRLYRWSGSRYI